MKYLNYLSLLLLLLTSAATFAQNKRTLRGVVSDLSGEPLIGANIIVKNSTPIIGAQSDADGKWSLEVPAEAKTLVFSYTGYTTKEIEIGAANDINVTLSEGVDMDDVVVTAMGIAREEKSLGYAVGKVDGSKVAGSGETNAIQGLAGKVSGIQVIGSSGMPGASSKILIRGNATFTGNNQPLMVVDGVPYDNQTLGSVAGDYPYNANLSGVGNSNRAVDLNPDDIESVNILKGPAAAALYGTRAANGVLVITTKKGKFGQAKPGMNVSFSSSIDVSQVNKLPELQQKYAHGRGGGDWLRDASGAYVLDASGNKIFGGASGNYLASGAPTSWGPDMDTDTLGLTAHDNYGNYFRTGVSYNNNLSISGGNQFSAFRLSYGNTSQQGIVPNTWLYRNTLRLNSQIGNDKFMVSGSAAYTNTRSSKAQMGSNLSGVMLSLTRMPSDFDILGGAGANGYDNADGSSYNYFAAYDNPLWSAYNNPNTDNVNRFTGNVQMVYTPIKDKMQTLAITYRLGGDMYDDQRKQIFAYGSNESTTGLGEIWENSKRRIEINSDFLVNYQRNINSDMSFGATVGNNLNHRQDKDLFARGRDLSIPGFNNIGNTSNLYASQGTVYKRLAGMFFDLNFSYKSMLFVNVAGRNDWASTFGANIRNKGFFYPSVSGSFVFTEVLPANKILSFGKLRASVAQSGIEPGAYNTVTYFDKPFVTDGFTPGLSFPYLGVNGYGYSSSMGNANLKPEILTGVEVGLDLRFWEGRINLDATYYNQTSSQLLVDRPIATSTGFKSYYVNAGKMRNQGVELELSGTAVDMKEFKWNIGVNFTLNRNEVLGLTQGVDRIDLESAFTGIGSFAIVGQPYGVIYGTKWVRDDQGRLIIGSNGLPKVGAQDRIGNPFPMWTSGITNTFTFYGVTISALLDIRRGGDIWNGTYARLTRLGQTAETLDRNRTYVIEGVREDGTTNTIPVSAFQYFTYYKGDQGGATENAIYSGSWVRLRELTVTYQIPTKGIKYLDKSTLSVYFTGRNLWLSTKYPGVDPETSLTGAGSNVNGFDYFNMPNTRSFIFGLKASF